MLRCDLHCFRFGWRDPSLFYLPFPDVKFFAIFGRPPFPDVKFYG